MRIERREPKIEALDWSTLDVIHLTGNELHHSARERSHKITEQKIDQFLNMIKWLLENPPVNTQPTELLSIEKLITYIESQKTYLMSPDSQSGTTLPEQLQQRAPDIRMHERQLIYPLSNNGYDAAEAISAELMLSRKKRRATARNSARLTTELEHCRRPYIITTSDTHTTTAHMLSALERNRNWQTSHTAVLSFDQHADMGVHLKKLADVPLKSNVMEYILGTYLADAIAIFGVGQQEGSVSDYAQQHTMDDLPTQEAFLLRLQEQLSAWKSMNIERIYTTVDLDSLRLYEMGYTGTDYNPLDTVRSMINNPALSSNANDLSEMQNTEPTARKVQLYRNIVFQNLMRHIFKNRSLQGIPDTWIPLAMQAAKAAGFEIGIQNNQTSQRVIGDIVEYLPTDYEQRTGRITQSIMGNMLKVAKS